MSTEVENHPRGVSGQLKRSFSEILISQFGTPLTAVRIEDSESIFRPSVIRGMTIVRPLRILEQIHKPKVQTKTAEGLFGSKIEENINSIPDKISKREQAMQTVILLPTKPAEVRVAQVVQESKEKPNNPRKNILNGFNSQAEVEALQKNAQVSSEQAVKENLSNMLRYHDEYTKSDPVVENPLMQDEDGDLVNSDSELKLLPLISGQERKGGVKEMMLTIQANLKEAEEGHVEVGVSAPGKTDTPAYQSEGEMIYTESQVYVYIKGKGRQIRALTFISDMTLEECIHFYQSFAEPDPIVLNKTAAEIDRVSELVRRPISITGGKIDFAGILKRIEDTMGGRKVMRAANGKERTFEEAYQLIELGEKVHSLPEQCQEVAHRYQNFLEANLARINEPGVAEAIRQRMDIAMLEMTRIINFKGDTQPDNLVYLKAFSTLTPQVMDMNLIYFIYQREIAYLLTRPGCNGSGETASATGQSLGDILKVGESSGGGGFRGNEVTIYPKCIKCKLELCDGGCPNCERKGM